MSNDLPPAGGPHPAPSTTTTTATATEPQNGNPDRNTGPARGMTDFFSWLRGFGIYRPDEGRWAAGVAEGLSRRWGIDPILIRGAFVALTLAGGLGVAAYGILWLLMPQQDGRIHLQEAVHGHFSAGFVAAVLLSTALFGDPGPWPGDNWYGGPPRFLALVFLGGLIWWMHRHQDGAARYSGPAEPVPSPSSESSPSYGTPPVMTKSLSPMLETPYPAAPPVVPPPVSPPAWSPVPRAPDLARASKRITRVTLGLALMVAAVIGFGGIGSPDETGLIAGAAALLVIAAGVITAGFTGRRSGGLAFFGLLTAFAVLVGAGIHEAGVRTGQHTVLAGTYTWTPATAGIASREFNLGLGQGELRLTNPAILTGATAANPLRVTVRLGAGQLTVVTPAGVPATVHVSLGAGQVLGPDGVAIDINPGNRNDDGGSTTQSTGPAGAPVLIVDVKQGAGEVHLETTPTAASPATPSITPSAKETSHV